MKIVLTIICIVGLVAGITFVSQYSVFERKDQVVAENPTPGTTEVVKGPKCPPLTILQNVVDWDPPSTGEWEIEAKGFHEFWFRNDNDVALDLGLQNKSCKCTDLVACLFTPEEAKRYRSWAAGSAAAELAAANLGLVAGFLPQFNTDRAVIAPARGAVVKWNPPMKADEHERYMALPAHSEGIIHAGWSGRVHDVGPDRLVIKFWIQEQGEGSNRPRDYPGLEIPILYVNPVQIVDISDRQVELGFKESRYTDSYCWSSTRGGFDLDVHEINNNPCIECQWFPMTDDQRAKLEAFTHSRILFGYRLRIGVHERVSDQATMDLGLFSKQLLVTIPTWRSLTMALNGVVHGDLSIGADDEKGRVRLGTFRSRNGVNKVLPIVSEREGVQIDPNDIKIEPPTLDYLKVRLEKPAIAPGTGRERWMMHVDIKPGCPTGSLDEKAAIVLKIKSTPPRLFRIPVSGIAYQ